MHKIQIVADEKIPFLKGALEPVADMVYLPGEKITASDVRQADALIVRTRTRCDRVLLEGSSVKMIATATIGYDHIDTAYCQAKGISWTNAPGCNSSSVEQYIVSALLKLLQERRTRPSEYTMGIVGVGNVGSKVARAAKTLGFNVLLNDPPRENSEGSEKFTPLDELLAGSDIVSLHVPLNRDGTYRTLGLADSTFFNMIRDGAVLMNTSRGEVVDEAALKTALKDKQISAAILDVFSGEPVIDRDLMDLAWIVTPHIAGYSTDGKANGTSMSVRAVSRHFDLGMDGWEAEGVPDPDEKEIFADAGQAPLLEVVGAVHKMTYAIALDDRALRSNPAHFEQLRGKYRVRREPGAYNVRLFNDDGTTGHLLEQLGFEVIDDSCF